MLSFAVDVQSGRQKCDSNVLHIEFVVSMEICNNKATSCVYVLDVCDSTDYLLLCYETGGLYYQ